ncbi:hypothetical protein ACFU99_17630 [Streptomyces sp. NPDC057654]|uniref:hypothetical protein n=1 Tax=Streptomyces sp. NPDC057654 TaxID=3346196 RepID=UPI0036B2CA93
MSDMPPDLARIPVLVADLGLPEMLDYSGRKLLVTPQTAIFFYRPGEDGPVQAHVHGPCRWGRGPRTTRFPLPRTSTIVFYRNWPQYWPDWLRDLGARHQPNGGGTLT